MSKTYQTKRARASGPKQFPVPAEVTIALEEIAGSAKEELLALAVGTGLQVMQVLMEEQVTALCGPRSKHNPERAGYRHGRGSGSVTLGGRRTPIEHPRVRAADGSSELAVPTYALFSQTELLGAMAMERMLAGLSTRRYRVGLEPLGAKVEASASAISRSAVSRKFVQATEDRAGRAARRPAPGARPGGADGRRGALRGALLRGRARYRRRRAQAPARARGGLDRKRHLVGLREHGLDVTRPILVVIDGSKALRRALLDVFEQPLIQRCQLHKVRNVKDKLPERLRSTVERRMRQAYRADSALDAEAQLLALARELDKTHPGAAASLREGLAETLTVLRLDVPPTLARTLRSTNPVESMLSICREHAKNVKRWRDGRMALRWCAAGMLEAAKQFRRVNGHLHLAALRVALERDAADRSSAGGGKRQIA